MHFQYKTHLMPAEIEIFVATYRALMSYLFQWKSHLMTATINS